MNRKKTFVVVVLLGILSSFRYPNVILAESKGKAHLAGPRHVQESEEEKKLREQQRKERERKDKEAQKRAREISKYVTLREFSEDLYASDSDFRNEVDEEFQNLQARHALEAFQINTGAKKERGDRSEQDDLDDLRIERVLYGNPWVQEYVNRVGQQLVPDDSDKLYAFKVIVNPIPSAYTLSTGTVFISTGMLSLLDNEAQMAYVLAHEAAHVYKDHWRVKVMMPLAEKEFNERQEKKKRRMAILVGAIGAAVGAGIKGREGILPGLATGAAGGYIIGAIMNRKIGVDWESVQENEADAFALRAVMRRNYDPKEIPKLFAELRRQSNTDKRIGLGFLADAIRLRERMEYLSRALPSSFQGETADFLKGGSGQPAGTSDKSLPADLENQYQELVKSGRMIGTTPDFNLIMAEMKRDNGILALQYDMFRVARKNLQQAVSLRSDDPVAAYYYGRVLKLVGRTKDESESAQRYLKLAIQLDERKLLPDTELHRALMLMDGREESARAEALEALKTYVLTYQRKQVGELRNDISLPPNLLQLYDYMRLLGDRTWVPPAPEFVRLQSTGPGIPVTAAAPPAAPQPAPQPPPPVPTPVRRRK